MSDYPSSAGDSSNEAELAELWEQVRKKFATSNMVELNLTSLAQNAETQDWPIDGEDETPSKYIDFSYEELKMLPELAPDPSRIELLIDILHETLAFDTGFEDLEIGEDTNDLQIRKNLKELGIPEEYPIDLTNLDDEAKDLCHAEGIENIGQFADFAQNMAQNVVIGGDFRTLTNALTQSDEEEIANYLPYRQGSTGLHIPEAFGMLIRPLSDDMKHALAKKAGVKFSEEEEAKFTEVSAHELSRVEQDIHEKLKPILVWFGDEWESLQKKKQEGGDIRRQLLVLGDETVETIALYFMEMQFSGKAPKETKAPTKGGGFFGKLFGGKKR